MHIYKLILAVVGISCAVASPVPQSNNDELESCNGNCKSAYDSCMNDAGKGDVPEAEWYVTQRILKP